MGKNKSANSSRTASGSMLASTGTEGDATTSGAEEDSSDDDTTAGEDGNQVDEKSSFERLDERSELEKQIFEAIEEGNLEEVRELIAENKKEIDVEHKDQSGHDMVTHAVINGKEAMVKLIVGIDKDRVPINEALLHAIKLDKMKITKLLLKVEDSRQSVGSVRSKPGERVIVTKSRKSGKKQGYDDQLFDDSEYGNDMTPLMMAAHCGHYEIMHYLFEERGERLPRLHLPSCSCGQCRGATRNLERTKRRLNLLKALATPDYMIFMMGQDGSFDPVYESFYLSALIKQCIVEEPEHKAEYEEVVEELDNFPVELLNLCRTTEETKIFLSQKEGYVGPDTMPYPRLALAIESGHKDIVAHPNVQFLLQGDFHGPVWKKTKGNFEWGVKMAVTLLVMLFFPLVQMFLWFSLFCCSGLAPVQYLLSPRMKAWSKLASYTFFCILLFVMNTEDRANANGAVPTLYVKWLVFIYVGSLAVALLRRFVLHPGDFWRSGWNKMDLVTQVLFWGSFVSWVYLNARAEKLDTERVVKPRRTLAADDPLILEECAFAVASVFATLRLLRWCVLSRLIGPLQSGFYRMAKSHKMFLVIVAWTIISFALSTNILFRPYVNLTKFDEKELRMKGQPTDMMEFSKLTVHYFVGEISPDEVEIFKNKNLTTPRKGESGHSDGEIEQVTTQMVATFMCAAWNVVGIAFLKDSLFGMFGAAGEEVFEAKDKEWKFDRAREMLFYILDGNLAPPFNLIPHGKCIGSMIGWIATIVCRNDKKEAGCSCTECCWLRDVESPMDRMEKRVQYPVLLRSLFQRWFKMKADDDDDEATKEDVAEVMLKVKELREACAEIVGLSKRSSSKELMKGRGGASSPSEKSKGIVTRKPNSPAQKSGSGVNSPGQPGAGTDVRTQPAASQTNVSTTPTKDGTQKDMAKSSVEVMMTPKNKKK